MFEHVWLEFEFRNLFFSLSPSNDLTTMLCHQRFLVQCLLSIYWKLLSFLESIGSVFNSNAAWKVSLIIFTALIVSRAWPWHCLKWACNSISFIHVTTPVLAPTMLDVPLLHQYIKLYNPLIVYWTQDLFNTIEYLLFQIWYF